MRLKYTDEMANILQPDMTAHEGEGAVSQI